MKIKTEKVCPNKYPELFDEMLQHRAKEHVKRVESLSKELDSIIDKNGH